MEDLEWLGWHEHSVKMRYKMSMPSNMQPWTPHHCLSGVKQLPRNLDIIGVAYFAWRRASQQGSVAGKDDCPAWFVDISQGVQRSPWGSSPGCINQTSQIYSFELDRVLDVEDSCVVKPKFVWESCSYGSCRRSENLSSWVQIK